MTSAEGPERAPEVSAPRLRPAIRFRAGDACPRCLGEFVEDGEGLRCAECGHAVPPEAREPGPPSGEGGETAAAAPLGVDEAVDLILGPPRYDPSMLAKGEVTKERGEAPPQAAAAAEQTTADVEPGVREAADPPEAAFPESLVGAGVPETRDPPTTLEEALARIRQLEAERELWRQQVEKGQSAIAQLVERERRVEALKESEDRHMARAEAYREQLRLKKVELEVVKQQLEDLRRTLEGTRRRSWLFRGRRKR